VGEVRVKSDMLIAEECNHVEALYFKLLIFLVLCILILLNVNLLSPHVIAIVAVRLGLGLKIIDEIEGK